MVNIYVIMTLELFHIIFMGTVLFFKIRKAFKEKNVLDFAILWVLVLTTALVIYNAYINVSFGLGIPDNQLYIGYIELGTMLAMLSTAPYLWFLLNLLGWKKLFTLPFAAAFFTTIYMIMRPTNLLASVYIAGGFIPGSIALIITSIKRKHGLSFSIGLSVIMFIFTDTFVSPNIITLYYSLEYVLLVILLAGVTGWMDEKIFFDRKYRNEISNSWIAGKIKS